MKKRKLASLVALGMLVGVSSCSGCYYARVGYGQAKVMLGRESIDDVLAGGSLSPDEKAKLALVPRMRTFAHERLGLAKNGSYTKFYDTGSKPISWNVVACDATSFRAHTWSFPFVGEAAYKGFFDKEQADEEADRLRAQGLDVVVREVSAYSTLGWFDDPVFRRMLSRDVSELANTILHELTHATVFREGDQAFNESVATFVGNEGALAFLAAEYGPQARELAAARDSAADDAVFAAFIDDLYAKLDRLYGGPTTAAHKREAREAIFARARADFEAVRTTKMRSPKSWTWFAKRPLNNATILGFRHYHTDLDTFADVLQTVGGDFRKAIEIFREAADQPQPRAYLASWTQLARGKAEKS